MWSGSGPSRFEPLIRRYSLDKEAEWDPGPVWTRWRREKIPSLPAGNQTSVAQPAA